MTRAGLAVVVVVWAVLVGWVALSHPSGQARFATAGVVVLAGVVFLAVAALGRWVPWSPGLLLVVVVAVLLALPGSAAWSGGPTAPPLHYGNANGMLVVAGAAGALLVGSSAGSRVLLWSAPLLAFAGAFACVVLRAKAGLVVCLLLLLWYAVHRLGRPVWSVLSALVLTGVSWVGVVVLAVDPSVAPGPLVGALSRNRIELWHQALAITREYPVSGAGVGSFPRLSPLARSDHDLAWTHSAPLQFSAELGLVGLGLFALLIAGVLLTTGRWSLLVALVLLPTTIDYVLDFPVVVASVAAVAGSAWSLAGSSSGRGKPTLVPPGP